MATFKAFTKEIRYDTGHPLSVHRFLPADNRASVKTRCNIWLKVWANFFFFFFLRTLFQFGLTIAPIQNSGLINAKYNNALYGTIIIWYNK